MHMPDEYAQLSTAENSPDGVVNAATVKVLPDLELVAEASSGGRHGACPLLRSLAEQEAPPRVLADKGAGPPETRNCVSAGQT
jgi:hypothetical protein